MNKVFSLSGVVARKTLVPLVLALPLVSCYQPTEKTLVGRPPSSYGERPGQGYAAVALAGQDLGQSSGRISERGAAEGVVAGDSFDIDGLELVSDEDRGFAPGHAAYASLAEGGLSLGEGVSAAGLNAPYRSTTLSDADVGGAINLLEQAGRSGGLLGSQALGYGSAYLNRAGEGLLTGLVEGSAARLNFRLNDDGEFSGEGDAFLPFYDSTRSTAFAQVGVRSMEGTGNAKWEGLKTDTRWIGNFGVGQRWYPFAQGQGRDRSDGPWMLGYNAFLDADFSRSHLRGGAGVETQYDWLHLAGNYYFPLSDWKRGIGGVGDIVYEERAAEGIDLRLKGYVPFYRNVAVTGSYGQWFGDNVNGSTEKDPANWSYGVEYTPIPLLTAYVRQEETDGGKSSTDFGVRLTYRGGMSWEDQTSHAKVAGLTKMTRNAFVERENRIVTEQRKFDTKTGKVVKFNLLLDDEAPFELGARRDDVAFLVRDPLDAGGVARHAPLVLTWTGGEAFEQSQTLPTSAVTDERGRFTVPALTAKNEGIVTLTATHADGRAASAALSLENWEVALQWKDGQSVSIGGGAATPVALQVVKRRVPVGEAGRKSGPDAYGAARPAWGAATLGLEWGGSGGLTGTAKEVETDPSGAFLLTLGGSKAGEATLAAKMTDEARDKRKTAPFVLKVLPQLEFAVKKAPALYQDVPNGSEIEFYIGLREKQGGAAVPLGGAVLRLDWGAGFESRLPETLTTDGSGRFRVPAGALTPRQTGALDVGVEILNLADLPDWVEGGALIGKKAKEKLEVKDGALSLTVDPATAFYEGIATTASFALTDAEGRPATGTASLSWKDGEDGVFQGLPATASLDGSGRFKLTLTGKPAGGEATLLAKLGDGRSASKGAALKVESAEVKVVLVSGGPFYQGVAQDARFRLEDGSGRPQANQKGVVLSWGTAGVFPALSGTIATDAKGEFALPGLKGLTAGETTLAAKLSDSRSGVSGALRVQVPTLKLSLLTAGPFYVGIAKEATFRLTDGAGQALANQGGIVLSWDKAGVFEGLPATVATNARGEFSVSGLKGLSIGETALAAKLRDGRLGTSAPVKSESAEVKLVLLTTDPFYVGIAKEGTFRLTDASGQAVANQGGIALSWAKAGVFEGLPATVGTNVQGEFVLPGLKGLRIDETALTAKLSDGRTATSAPVTSVSADVKLSLLTTEPFYVGIAKEAKFRLSDASGQALANRSGIGLSWVKAGVFEGLPATVATDAKGEFVVPSLKGLRVDETALTAKLSDGRAATSAPVKSVDGVTTLTLLTTDPFYVGIAKEAKFRLSDGSGQALANQSGIGLSWVKAGVFEGLPATVATDAKGEFVVPGLKGLRVDETALTAKLPDGRAATSAPVTSVSAEVTLSLLTADPFYVGIAKEAKFRLSDGSGQALANRSGIGLSWVKAGVFEGLPATVATDAKGEFVVPSLKGLRVDETALTAKLSDGRAATSAPVKSVDGVTTLTLLTTDPFYVGIAKEAKFRLSDGSGQALANRNGIGLSWVKAGVFEGLPATVATDAKGEFVVPSLKGLRVDETALTAKLSDGRAATSAPVKSVDGVTTLTLLTTDPFYVGIAKEAKFRLSDGSGQALANRNGIGLSWVKAGVFEGLPATVATDAKGEFVVPSLKGLRVDETALTAKLSDGRAATSAPVKSVDGVTTLTLLTTDPFYVGIAKEATFRLTDGSGQALANRNGIGLSWVKAGVFEGLPATVSTDAQGEFVVPDLKGLRVDETALTAKLSDGRAATSAPVKSVDGVTTLTLLTTDPFYVGIAKEAKFRLADGSGQALANRSGIGLSWVKAGVFEGLPATVSTDAQGEFVVPSLKGLRVDETALTAKLSDGRAATSAPVKSVSAEVTLSLLTTDPFYVGIEKEAKFRLSDGSGQALANQSGIGLSWVKAGVFEGLPATVSTDAQGEFVVPSLKGLRVDETALTAKLSDGRAATSAPVKSVDGVTTLTLLTTDPFYVGIEKAATFRLTDASGQALANRSGIALSWVKAGVFEGLPATVSTDAKGEFSAPNLKGLKVDETALTAKLVDGRTATSAPVKSVSGVTTLSLLTTDPFYVGIEKAATFRLTDAAGQALANQGGIALSWAKAGVFEGLPATVSTDAKGEFSVPNLKGLKVDETALTATLTDGRTATSAPVKSVSGVTTLSLLTTDPFYVGIEKAATFRLTDAAGQALANQGGIALSWAKAGVFEGLPATVSTDAKGEFSVPNLKGLKVDETALTATLTDGRTATSAPVKSVSGVMTLSLLTTDPFYVGIAKEAKFRLSDGSGQALANQSGIGLSWVKAGVFEGLPATVSTDAKGEFVVPSLKGLRVDETALTAKLSDGRAATSAPVKTVDGVTTLTLLTTDPFYVGIAKEAKFRLSDGSGQALANRSGIGLSWVKAGVFEGLPATVATDAQGEFVVPSLKGLRVDETALTAKLSDGRAATSSGLKVEDGTITLIVASGGTKFFTGVEKKMEYLVLDAARRPLGGAKNISLSWQDPDRTVFPAASTLAKVETNVDGRFYLHLKAAKVGQTALRAQLEDGRSAVSAIHDAKEGGGVILEEFPKSGTLYPGLIKNLTYRLRTVADGKPITDLKGVQLLWQGTEILDVAPVTSVDTDGNGMFILDNIIPLKPGSARMVAVLPDERRSNEAAVVVYDPVLKLEPAASKDGVLEVNTAKDLSYYVKDAYGTLLQNRPLKVVVSTPSSPMGYQKSVQTTTEGRINLTGVSGGTRGGEGVVKVTLLDIVERVGTLPLSVVDSALTLDPVRDADTWFRAGETKDLSYYVKDWKGNLLRNVPVFLQFEGAGRSTSYGVNLTVGSDGILRTPGLMGGAKSDVEGQARMTVSMQSAPDRKGVRFLPVFPPPKLVLEKQEVKSDPQGGKTHNVVTLRLDGVLNPQVGRPSASRPATVTWSVTDVHTWNAAVAPGWDRKATGLTWGGGEPVTNRVGYTPEIGVLRETVSVSSMLMQLKDIVGHRTIIVKASIEGIEDLSVRVDTGFLDLASFSKLPVQTVWAEGSQAGIRNGVLVNGKHKALAICGGTTNGMKASGSYPQTKTGSEAALLKVGNGPRGYGAAYAVGWPAGRYWTDHFLGVWQTKKDSFVGENFQADLSGNFGMTAHLNASGYLTCML